jgi:hypothetical protein
MDAKGLSRTCSPAPTRPSATSRWVREALHRQPFTEASDPKEQSNSKEEGRPTEPGKFEGAEPAIMPGAEAKSKKPKYKEYKRARDAQNFARKLGAKNVDYGGRVDIANVCNHVLSLASQREVPMPQGVIVQEDFSAENEDPDELAYYVHAGGAPGEVHVNGAHEAWADLEEYTRQARATNRISTDSPDHFIMHELGELALHQSVGEDRFDKQGEQYEQEEAEFRAMGEPDQGYVSDEEGRYPLDIIADEVSDRASDDHSEFVAETFAALMLGREELRENEVVMDAFRRFGGDKVVGWTTPEG